jgi:catechol 2,3-dioxygenase-like lactoylglutathione lyase family enzyme
MSSGIAGLHHSAYRCRDSEATRKFYEDFLGLPLTCTLRISETKTGREVEALHTFYAMDNGGMIAFFEVPHRPHDFIQQHDYDLHIALEVSREHMLAMKAKAEAEGREVRGVADHGFIHSIYFRDPNGYVVELACPTPAHDTYIDRRHNGARAKLDAWQSAKSRA